MKHMINRLLHAFSCNFGYNCTEARKLSDHSISIGGKSLILDKNLYFLSIRIFLKLFPEKLFSNY